MRSITGTSIISIVEDALNLLVLGTIENIGSGIPTTASTFAPGAIIVDKSTHLLYFNHGTTAVPAWVTSPSKYLSVVTSTNATTPVDVFSSAGAPCAIRVTSVVSVAKDTTAGNITLAQAGNTVCTIAKGTTAG